MVFIHLTLISNMRNLTIIKTKKGKSARAWNKKKRIHSVVKNYILAWLASHLTENFNQYFYKLAGIKIGKNVQIMPEVKMEIFFPENITIGNNVVIGQDAFLAGHEFNVNEFRYGPITIEDDVLIGARSFILPGVTIGKGSLVSANTTVYKDVPKGVVAFGSPMQFKKIKK
jgi:acetyltransferase-like isoleucine patch superfamily enzyme